MKKWAVALAILSVSGVAAAAAPSTHGEIPGVVGINHVGFTVPNEAQAVKFFHEVLGCQKAYEFGPFEDKKDDLMKDMLNVNPRAVIDHLTMMRCGEGSNIEIFQYTAPDQKTAYPLNSDMGGFHIAFYVKNEDVAVKKARALGLKVLKGPVPIKTGPAAGQTVNYVLTPWGQQLELISYPKGMAYEHDTKVRLWAPHGGY